MAAASDKARFYLEQLAPELRLYEKKKIFSKSEISSITKKRSEFEHRINARGPQPSDYARYAEYEMNLDALCRKRTKRLGIKNMSQTGQRRIFFILDRATKKFHGDISLWVQYIDYARKQEAHKKLAQIFTNALRLHPTEVELWICAAQYALQDHGDITQARSYMQRGLRFCKTTSVLWLQYAKLEMIYIARIAARQKILGLDGTTVAQPSDESIDNQSHVVGKDLIPTHDGEGSDRALQTLKSTPALSGAIPIAIFEAAMEQFGNDDSIGHSFYHMVAEFEESPCLHRVLTHVVEFMITHHPTSAWAQECYTKYPVAGIGPSSAQFPRAFSSSLNRIKEYTADENPAVYQYADQIIRWLDSLLSTEDLDPALRKVIEAVVKSTRRKSSSCRDG